MSFFSNNYKFWKISIDILKKCYKYLQYTVETRGKLCYDNDIIWNIMKEYFLGGFD